MWTSRFKMGKVGFVDYRKCNQTIGALGQEVTLKHVDKITLEILLVLVIKLPY